MSPFPLVTLVARDVASDSKARSSSATSASSRCRAMRASPARATIVAHSCCASIASLRRAGSIDGGKDGDEEERCSPPVRVPSASVSSPLSPDDGDDVGSAPEKRGEPGECGRARGLAGFGPTGGVDPSEPSLSLMAYLSVFSVCSAWPCPGETCARSTVLLFFPMNASLSTCVSLLPRNGTLCSPTKLGSAARAPPSLPPFTPHPTDSARMHSLRASSDLLISAPSRLIRWSTSLPLSAPRSDPARSTSASLEGILLTPSSPGSFDLSVTWNTACERELVALPSVLLVFLHRIPRSTSERTSVASSAVTSRSPTILVRPRASSRAWQGALSLSRS